MKRRWSYTSLKLNRSGPCEMVVLLRHNNNKNIKIKYKIHRNLQLTRIPITVIFGNPLCLLLQCARRAFECNKRIHSIRMWLKMLRRIIPQTVLWRTLLRRQNAECVAFDCHNYQQNIIIVSNGWGWFVFATWCLCGTSNKHWGVTRLYSYSVMFYI